MQPKNRIGDKIRQIREFQNLSVEDLAQRSGSSADLIEQLEAGDLVPSLAPLMKIARALGVRLGTFLDDEAHDSPVVVRAGRSDSVVRFSGGQRSSNGSVLDFFSLGAGKVDRHMEPFLIDVRLPRDGEHELSSHEGEEFIYVLSGEVELCYGTEKHRAGAGDSLYYDSVVAHHLHAAGDGDAKILAVVYTPL